MKDDRANLDQVRKRMPATPHIPSKPTKESSQIVPEIELRDDGESRFRAAVHAAAKSGPMHRTAKS